MSPEGKDAADGRPSRSVLNPLDALIITRTKLQDTLDDAVRRGRMTRDDATELLAEIVRRAEGALSGPADVVRRVAGGADPFPIEDYDDLTAAEVNAHLGTLDAGGLRRVRDYERRNANRKTVLAAVDQRLQAPGSAER